MNLIPLHFEEKISLDGEITLGGSLIADANLVITWSRNPHTQRHQFSESQVNQV
jgi:hypothetical protein